MSSRDQFLPPQVLIAEVLDGPYEGLITEVNAGATIAYVRPSRGDRPFERHRRADIDGTPALAYAPLLTRTDTH